MPRERTKKENDEQFFQERMWKSVRQVIKNTKTCWHCTQEEAIEKVKQMLDEIHVGIQKPERKVKIFKIEQQEDQK